MKLKLDIFRREDFMRTVLLLIVGAVFGTLLVVQLVAQDSPSQPAQPSFPDTNALVSRVAEHQKAVEALFNQYTCTYKSTVYTLDKAGSIRSQHTDTYYMTPTPYEVFMLHISHDGKGISQDNLEKQEREIERKLRNYERKAQNNPNARPKDALLFADIILKSRFTPLRWENVSGVPTVVYSFEPKAQPTRHGTSEDKIAGDLKGTMWVDPEDGEIVRMEFVSVSSLSLGVLVNVKGFQGFVEQRKINGEVWLPSRQDFVAQGRELIKGFRIRQVTEFSDYLKATTDVLQQVHPPTAVAGDGIQVQQ
jgi:outer membrane lipoprotein-sorting protein